MMIASNDHEELTPAIALARAAELKPTMLVLAAIHVIDGENCCTVSLSGIGEARKANMDWILAQITIRVQDWLRGHD